ncbi:Glycosyl transferase, family 2 [Calothrix sp. PCC 7716]|nr:Glycosyl transferase, family 2 [Calothrix sp. PCC 7716]
MIPKFYPSVTIAIPTYNEALNIEQIIRCFINSGYKNIVEIFVADGGSTDNTQDIVRRLSKEDSRIKLLYNPLKIQSAGLNLILHSSTGEIFLRADAHSEYAPDYVERCVEALIESNALNAGGAQRFVAKTRFQAAIAIASKSILSNGGAKYRNPNYNGYADTVYLGCFWRKALQEVSGFNSTYHHNEDAELNQRLLTQKLNAIYISSVVRVWYYPRNTWKSLWLQYFKYGQGRCLTSIKYKLSTQLRGIIPFLALSTISLLLVVDLLLPSLHLPIEQLVFICILIPFLESFRVILKYHNNFRLEVWQGNNDEIPSWISSWFLCGITLLTMPIAHSLGYAYQLLRLLLQSRQLSTTSLM